MLNKLLVVWGIAAVYMAVAIPSFAGKIAPAVKLSEGNVLLEIPTAGFDREYLLSACVSKTDHYKWLEVGTRPSTLHVRFERLGDTVYLRRINTSVVGHPSDTLSIQSIKDNYMDSYVLALPVKSTDANGTVTVDATRLFLSDQILSPFSRWFKRAKVTLDKDLSHIVECKSFDDNLSVRTVLSFNHDQSERQLPKNCSAEILNSLLLLPEQKMRPRLGDSRIGLFSTEKKSVDFDVSDYIQDIDYVERWRVEPSDFDAWARGELVSPQKQIVFFIDNAFPESWKEPLRKGILDWNDAFERIGLKDVIAVKEYPTDDPDFDEDNLKYSTIRYIPTDRGGAQGPSWVDPTTGEVLCASVYVWGSMPEIMSRFCYVQTAHANPAIRNGKFPEEQLAATIRFTIAHEIGHTLGLAHNMGGSSVYPTDSLLSASFVEKHGLTASTMDYIFYNYILPPGNPDHVPLMSTLLGDYDRMLIDYIYHPTSTDLSTNEDHSFVQSRLDKSLENPYCRYGRQQWGNKYDPLTLIYDLGNDPQKTGDLSISNLQYVLSHLEEWLPGGDNAVLRGKLYESLVEHYETLIRSVIHQVGGIRINMIDQQRNQQNIPLPSSLQHEAMLWAASKLHTSDWLNNSPLLSRLPLSESALAKMINTLSAELVKMSSNVVLSSSLSDNPYTLSDYADDLFTQFFALTDVSPAGMILQRSLIKAINEAEQAGTKSEVNVDLISEEAGAWSTLKSRIHDWAERQLRRKTDHQLHWTIMAELSKK